MLPDNTVASIHDDVNQTIVYFLSVHETCTTRNSFGDIWRWKLLRWFTNIKFVVR